VLGVFGVLVAGNRLGRKTQANNEWTTTITCKLLTLIYTL